MTLASSTLASIVAEGSPTAAARVLPMAPEGLAERHVRTLHGLAGGRVDVAGAVLFAGFALVHTAYDAALHARADQQRNVLRVLVLAAIGHVLGLRRAAMTPAAPAM